MPFYRLDRLLLDIGSQRHNPHLFQYCKAPPPLCTDLGQVGSGYSMFRSLSHLALTTATAFKRCTSIQCSVWTRSCKIKKQCQLLCLSISRSCNHWWNVWWIDARPPWCLAFHLILWSRHRARVGPSTHVLACFGKTHLGFHWILYQLLWAIHLISFLNRGEAQHFWPWE